MNEPSCVERESQIRSEFQRLERAKEELHNRINLLCERLTDVLLPPEPRPDGTSKTAGISQQSPIALTISEICKVIDADIERINDIISRLEI